MHLWQLDLVSGTYLTDGRECKMLTGIDDQPRFVGVAAVLAVPSGRAVPDAFLRAMRSYGVPGEVLNDNGKQFTGRFTRPRPAEVLSERVCRENGITQKLTKPYSPTTTGKIERWHATLHRELLDVSSPFADLPAAQAAISGWRTPITTTGLTKRHGHSGQPVPPCGQHEPLKVVTAAAALQSAGAALEAAPDGAAAAAGSWDGATGTVLPPSAGAVEFDTVIAPGGQLTGLSAVQRIRMGAQRGG
jgi:hypothetical protein